ncbi:MAG: hypothetical protein JNM63_14335, partial [Spirochaetia bacterium]|nr:hypothetical protein [Spirochaetia bacterium]
DFEGKLGVGETRAIEIEVSPSASAKGAFPVGLAVLTAKGNSLALTDLEIKP